jgi:hypothetical protein
LRYSINIIQNAYKIYTGGLHHWFTEAQKQQILEIFGSEPVDYEWSEQDIAENIRKIIRDNR